MANILQHAARTGRSAADGAHFRLTLGSDRVAYALIPSILGAVRDLAGDLRAVLAVCIGLQLLAAMLGALSSLSSARV